MGPGRSSDLNRLTPQPSAPKETQVAGPANNQAGQTTNRKRSVYLYPAAQVRYCIKHKMEPRNRRLRGFVVSGQKKLDSNPVFMRS